MEHSPLHYIALTKTDRVGPVLAKNLISYCGSVEGVFSESSKNLAKIPGVGLATIKCLKDKEIWGKAEAELAHVEKNKIELLFYLDEKYPSRLKHYPDSPLVLYKKGMANHDPSRTIALVGTRDCSTYGKLQTEEMVEGLEKYGVTTISGLAHGIDTLTHKHSLNHNIPTIGIMGGGFNKIYPSANRKLASQMMSESGAVMTEFGFMQLPDREHFPMRNRIIAALSDAVIVVESARKGGSIITAEFANSYHKDVFAIPGRTNDEKSAGCNHLIKIHKAALAQSAEDIAYIMGWEKTKEIVQMKLPLETFNLEEQKIVNILQSEGKIQFDKIHYKTGIHLSSLSQILLGLEFKGIIKSLPGKSYLLSKHSYQN